jgi:hypothetical protein
VAGASPIFHYPFKETNSRTIFSEVHMTEHPFNNDSTPAERLQVHKNTMHTRTVAEAAEPRGRFTAHEKSTVIGATAIPKYPELPSNSPFHHDPVPNEAPLGFSIEDHAPVGTAKEIAASLKRLNEDEPPEAA